MKFKKSPTVTSGENSTDYEPVPTEEEPEHVKDADADQILPDKSISLSMEAEYKRLQMQ